MGNKVCGEQPLFLNVMLPAFGHSGAEKRFQWDVPTNQIVSFMAGM